MMHQPTRSVDGVTRRPPTQTTIATARPAPVAPAATPTRRAYAKPQAAAPRKKRLPSWLELPLIITLAMTAGMLAQSAVLGQAIIVAYGIAAFIWRIPSRITFTLALVALSTTIILLVGKGNAPLAQNFATYTFLLLAAGVISLGRELKREGGRVYSIRERNINNW